ncbi:hypothetical protein PEC301877_08990 [Pectobacterium carotovorum subsp. carotovorum]|nr:hypothetical protein PEC301877_08990 [Pectobacterium carotovorum subsp. carotovorum]
MMFSRRFIRRSFLWRITYGPSLTTLKMSAGNFYGDTDLTQNRKVKTTKRMTF